MKQWSGWKSVWGIAITLMAAEIVLFGLYHTPAVVWLGYCGWIVLWCAAFFGVVPVFMFRQKGGVAEGTSYINTTVLVDSGLYAILRHPQYLSFIMICLGIVLVAQTALVVVIGVPAMLLFYIAIRQQDHFLTEKFGDEYTQYMKKVPSINILLGIIRVLHRRVKSNQ
ncbi:MAG: hypothetical protein AYK18_12895 [Theionarchaea archaeon DG-70]|nr:MAG: hypothetical protein AYK18_12895 [Theionarchaea archaeon DG-70]